MQMQTAGRLEHAMQFQQTVRHHHEIRHHVVLAEERAQRGHQLGDVGIRLVQDFVELALGLLAPMPGILERGDLRVATRGPSAS